MAWTYSQWASLQAKLPPEDQMSWEDFSAAANATTEESDDSSKPNVPHGAAPQPGDEEESGSQESNANKYYNYYTGEWVDSPDQIKPRTYSTDSGDEDSGDSDDGDHSYSDKSGDDGDEGDSGDSNDGENDSEEYDDTGSYDETGDSDDSEDSDDSSNYYTPPPPPPPQTNNQQSQEERQVGSAPVAPPSPPPPPPPPPIKTAPIDTILFDNDAVDTALITDLLFENIGGQEILTIARYDTVNGQDVSYQPIKNLNILQEEYNPNNILKLQKISPQIFANFPINLSAKIPNEGTGVNGESVYIDGDGNLVVEFVNLEPDEQIEVQVTTNGTIYEVGI